MTARKLSRRPFDERTFQGVGILLNRLPRNEAGNVEIPDSLAKSIAAFMLGTRASWTDLKLSDALEQDQ